MLRTSTRTFSSRSSPRQNNVIIFLGGPGSGKGTQCERLVSDFGWTHLSAGSLLRKAALTNTEISTYINSGTIVPSHVTLKLLENEIFSAQNPSTAINDNLSPLELCFSRQNTFIIDGFPRNSENNSAFVAQLLPKVHLAAVVLLTCPQSVILERLALRQRADDNIETVRRRFKVYEEDTLPVIEYYDRWFGSPQGQASGGAVVRVNGNQSVEAVYRELKEKLTSTLSAQL